MNGGHPQVSAAPSVVRFRSRGRTEGLDLYLTDRATGAGKRRLRLFAWEGRAQAEFVQH
jgi:hypothetical protein